MKKTRRLEQEGAGAMNYKIMFPPNTKNATAIFGKFTIAVTCPHCDQTHHHQRIDAYMSYVPAVCGKGYYVIPRPPLAAKRDGQP
jgi:hypothetical protein